MQPPEAREDSPGRPSDAVVAAAQKLVNNAELIDVRTVHLAATLADGVVPGQHVAAVEMEVGLSFATGEGVYGSRFEYRFEFHTEDGSTLGNIEFSLVADYAVSEGFTPDDEAADFVTSTTGFFTAYPYAREVLQSLATRLQFDPVVLGMIKRDSMQPGTVTVAPHRPSNADR